MLLMLTLTDPSAPVVPFRLASLTRAVPPTAVKEPVISTSPVLRTAMSVTGWLGVPTANVGVAGSRAGVKGGQPAEQRATDL